MRFSLSLIGLAFFNIMSAQTNPAITSWIVNHSGASGFASIQTNVQQVQYSSNNVYVSTNDIADWIPVGYDWPNNPWSPEAQNFVFKITLNPEENTGNKVTTPYGHIGIWTNGVSIYNPKDAKTWQDSGVWFQNAYYFEHTHMETFDLCLGHPNNMHEYHLHVNPTCLYDDTDSTHHAPLIGFAFDGFPIYGAYAYSNTNGTGPIKRMRSSYRLRNITQRNTLPNGTQLPASQVGPIITFYPLGAYMEDFEYVEGLGDLDQWNGRFCITPEYPEGIYAYFTTIDEAQTPVFPYVLGPKFFGKVQMGNTGPNSGHNVINEPVTVYTSVNDVENEILFSVFPNPANDQFNLFLTPSLSSNMTAMLFNSQGQLVQFQENVQTGVDYTFETGNLPTGMYSLQISEGGNRTVKKIIIAR